MNWNYLLKSYRLFSQKSFFFFFCKWHFICREGRDLKDRWVGVKKGVPGQRCGRIGCRSLEIVLSLSFRGVWVSWSREVLGLCPKLGRRFSSNRSQWGSCTCCYFACELKHFLPLFSQFPETFIKWDGGMKTLFVISDVINKKYITSEQACLPFKKKKNPTPS